MVKASKLTIEDNSPIIPFLHADILYKLFQFFSYQELGTSVMHVSKLWRYIATKRMRKLRVLEFKYENLDPVAADETGAYSLFDQEDYYWVRMNQRFLGQRFVSYATFLPPLLLNDEIDPDWAIILYGMRKPYVEEIQVWGAFHPNTPSSVTALNVQLEISFIFTKEDNTKWKANKHIVATLESGAGRPLCTLYDISDLQSTTFTTNVAIGRILPGQKWYYWGLAPRFSEDGTFDKINCDSLYGTFDSSREWRRLVIDDGYDDIEHIHLPPLVLTKENVVLCVDGTRIGVSGTTLQFRVKYHPSTHGGVKSREMTFQLDFYFKTKWRTRFPYSTWNHRHSEFTTSVGHDWTWINIIDLPYDRISFDVPPIIRFRILPSRPGNRTVVTAKFAPRVLPAPYPTIPPRCVIIGRQSPCTLH